MHDPSLLQPFSKKPVPLSRNLRYAYLHQFPIQMNTKFIIFAVMIIIIMTIMHDLYRKSPISKNVIHNHYTKHI